MFHVEHAKNQKSAKNKFCGFFSFSNYFQKNEKKLDFFKFLARARQCKVNDQCPFGPQKCVTGIGANGRVFSENWRGGASSSATTMNVKYFLRVCAK
jgi:hypothetical protein